MGGMISAPKVDKSAAEAARVEAERARQEREQIQEDLEAKSLIYRTGGAGRRSLLSNTTIGFPSGGRGLMANERSATRYTGTTPAPLTDRRRAQSMLNQVLRPFDRR